jgi:hypothetical protein
MCFVIDEVGHVIGRIVGKADTIIERAHLSKEMA